MCTVSGICTMYLLSLCSLRAFVSSMRRTVSYLPAACLSLSTSYDIFFIFFFSLLQSSGSYVHCIVRRNGCVGVAARGKRRRAWREGLGRRCSMGGCSHERG